jgi:small subunit ribosomal protein S8
MSNYFFDIFIKIQNGQLSKNSYIYTKRIKNAEKLLKLLWLDGLILSYTIETIKIKKFKIFLKYIDNKPAINSIKFISKPGRKVYFSKDQINKINLNKHYIIFSTNKGLKSIDDCKKLQIGGEPLVLIS